MEFNFTTLGTASALPTDSRYPSAHVLNIRGRLFLIDCGEGVQVLLHRHKFSMLKFDNIFISHLHGDHCLGIFGLLSSMGMKGRTAKLTIHAPEGFKAMLDFFKANFEGDSIKYEIEHQVLQPGTNRIFESRNIEAFSFPLNHRVPTYGFLFREKVPPLNIVKESIDKYALNLKEIASLKRGEMVVRENGDILDPAEHTYIPFKSRSFAYCSDTAPLDGLEETVKGVDLLYHEATFAQDLKQTAIATYHSTATDAALVAKRARAGSLVIGHFSSRYGSTEHLLKEAAEIFPNTHLASTGAKFEVELKKH